MDTLLEKLKFTRTRKKDMEKLTQIIMSHLPDHEVSVHKSKSVHNIIIGNIEEADYIFTAHGDTVPFKNGILLTPIAQLFRMIKLPYFGHIIGGILLSRIISSIDDTYFRPHFDLLVSPLESQVLLTDCLYFLYFFLPILLIIWPFSKPEGGDDNTSGVVGAIELYKRMNSVVKCAVVIFDKEEIGLLGSKHFKSYYYKTLPGKTIINLDCIGRGHSIFATSRLAHDFVDFAKCQGRQVKKTMPMSDDITFKNMDSVQVLGVIRGNKLLGQKNIMWVHTKYDTYNKIDPALIDDVVDLLAGFVMDQEAKNVDYQVALTG